MDRKFISGSEKYCTREEHLNAPILRKEFTVELPVENATLEIAAVGFYRAFLNGREITKGYLAPYISNPDDIVYYDEYNVDEYLQKENVLCLLLGNGFSNAMDCGVWDFESATTRAAPKVYACLRCGDKQVLTTDETFDAFDSAITFDDLRCGERYDARLERTELFAFSNGKPLAGARKAVLTTTPKGEYRKCQAEPIQEEYRIRAKRIFAAENGYIFDFGEVNAGICSLHIHGKEGQKLSFDFGEMVVDGKLDTRNLYFTQTKKGYVQHDEYICRNGWQRWSPSFTYHGYRYVYVEGLDEGQATEDLLDYIVIHSNVKQRGTFACDNDILNKIFDCALRSDKSNLFYIPTDCPQREKNGWTADASLSSEQFLYNLDCVETLREWLRNVCKAQRENGMLPGIVPTTGWGYAWGNGPAWDSVIVEMPYQLYRFTGDREIIRENITAILRYFDFIAAKFQEEGLEKFGLGDWCEVEAITFGWYSTPLEYTNLLTLLDMANKASYLLECMGDRQSDILRLNDYRNAFLQYFREKYLQEGSITCKTQTALAMAIVIDGVLTVDERKQAQRELTALFEERNDRFKVGVVGAKYLFDALTKAGETDRALRAIVGPDFPSYGYWIKNGATTLWEAFMRLGADGQMQREDGSRLDSINHHFWGTVVGWFYRVLGGLDIQPDRNIAVQIPETSLLNSVQCSWQSAEKSIAVQWKKTDDEIVVEVKNNGFNGTIQWKNENKIPLQAGEKRYIIKDRCYDGFAK